MSDHMATQRNRRTWRRRFAIVGVNLSLLVIGLTAVELIFGNWVRADALNRLHLIRARAYDFSVRDLYAAPFDSIHYTRDRFGLRGQFHHPHEIDILTVGGSTTDQRYIADGSTWQDVIQNAFAREGKEVVVGNAGVDGQTTVGHLRDFEWWFPEVPGLAPEYILFYVGGNDFHVPSGGLGDRTVDGGPMPELRERFANNSALCCLYRSLEGNLRAEVICNIGHHHEDFAVCTWTTEPLHAESALLLGDRPAAYELRLRELIVRTRALGAEPIVVSQPMHRYRWREGVLEGVAEPFDYDGVPINGVDCYRMLRTLDRVAARVCAEADVMFIDAGGQPIWEDADFYDFMHMTPAGAKKLGELLFASLRQSLTADPNSAAK
jgi:hypothetical protein